MKNTGKFLSTVMLLLMLTVVIAAIPTEADAAIYTDTLRLHIRARSDSDVDQAVKLEIRDRLLDRYSDLLLSTGREGAEELLRERCEEIRGEVDGWLSELGCDYGCEVRVGVERFDTREYGGFTLPSGEYTALIVELGGGEGANWWCVMYPPMCLDVATSDSYTPRERELIAGGKYSVRFKLLELCAELIG